MSSATANSKGDTHSKDVHEIVTSKVIEQLEKSVVPWRVSWAKAGLPKNLITKNAYRGINSMLLAMLGYEHNYFITTKQLKEIDGAIQPDAKPHIIVFWNFSEKDPVDLEKEEKGKKKPPFLRYYTVYNIAQCVGIPLELLPDVEEVQERDSFNECESIIKNMPLCPEIRHKEPYPYFDCRLNYVNVPKIKTFEQPGCYYITLLHELVHSTGHHTRLDRVGLAQMTESGSQPITLEELITEIGTCYLQSLTGITCEDEHDADYLQGWLKKLRDDKYFILNAAAQAQKAVDFILNVKVEDKGHNEE